MLPLSNPYDREVLFEYLAEWVRRHATVRLRVGASIYTVVASDGGGALICTGCHRPIARLAFRVVAGVLCAACGRTTVIAGNGSDSAEIRRAV